MVDRRETVLGVMSDTIRLAQQAIQHSPSQTLKGQLDELISQYSRSITNDESLDLVCAILGSLPLITADGFGLPEHKTAETIKRHAEAIRAGFEVIVGNKNKIGRDVFGDARGGDFRDGDLWGDDRREGDKIVAHHDYKPPKP